MKNPEISVVVATYNELDNIKKLIPALEATLKGRNFEIVIVDDSSPDGTAAEAENQNAKYGNIRVITQGKKEGVGKAHLVGYKGSYGKTIVSMDADFSHDPKEIPKMLDTLSKGYDIVVGSRYVEGGETDKSKLKMLVSFYGGKIASKLFRLQLLKDYTNSFRAFKKEIVQNLEPFMEKGNAFLMEFLIKAMEKDYRVTEVPITFIERTVGDSKVDYPREAYKTLKFLIKYRLGKKL